MSVDTEWRRLQGLYAGLGDGDLLRLMRQREELTGVAQQALDAETASRGLALPAAVEDEVEADGVLAEVECGLLELATFANAYEARTALALLDENDIPVKVEQGWRRETADGPKIPMDWVSIFIERKDEAAAVGLLRSALGMFPEAEEDGGVDDTQEAEGVGDLFLAGDFETEEDFVTAQQVLREAGIWVSAARERYERMGKSEVRVEGRFVEVRFEDAERAVGLVEKAFGEG